MIFFNESKKGLIILLRASFCLVIVGSRRSDVTARFVEINFENWIGSLRDIPFIW